MTEEITNDIDKLDGMIKIKGKCGYEIIGGCSDLRRLKQEHNELQEKLFTLADTYQEARDTCKCLEQENKELKIKHQRYRECSMQLNKKYKSALEEINRVIKLAHKVEDYLLGQDYTDLVDRIEKEINEVLR